MKDSILMRTGFFSAIIKFGCVAGCGPENGAGYCKRKNAVRLSNIELAFPPAEDRTTERRIA
jgi:hypothetical protein